MSPIPSVNLNTRELTRINFLSQENLNLILMSSEIFPLIPVICGKNAEKITNSSKMVY